MTSMDSSSLFQQRNIGAESDMSNLIATLVALDTLTHIVHVFFTISFSLFRILFCLFIFFKRSFVFLSFGSSTLHSTLNTDIEFFSC
jgi:hypothetical protein